MTVSASFGTGVNAFGDRRGIRARGGNAGGDGMLAEGGFGINAGLGIRASGGGTDILGGTGGVGVLAVGGDSFKGTPGDGVVATGGFTEFGLGSAGVRATGGDSIELVGGIGVRAEGGTSVNTFGGAGVHAVGGLGHGSGHRGGAGIFAQGGLGQEGAGFGLAGEFNGDVEINGSLSKSSGSFKIDHPLDPANKYLYHSFVESPDMKNIYDGNVVTDQNGDAVVELPAYFEALNRDFRYQLTVVGTFAQAIVADEIKDNRFRIKTNAPSVKVSWQVTGIRQDAYANKNRIMVEVDKPEPERGYYLHPNVFNQPEERGLEWARYPALIREMKERREGAQKQQAGLTHKSVNKQLR